MNGLIEKVVLQDIPGSGELTPLAWWYTDNYVCGAMSMLLLDSRKAAAWLSRTREAVALYRHTASRLSGSAPAYSMAPMVSGWLRSVCTAEGPN